MTLNNYLLKQGRITPCSLIFPIICHVNYSDVWTSSESGPILDHCHWILHGHKVEDPYPYNSSVSSCLCVAINRITHYWITLIRAYVNCLLNSWISGVLIRHFHLLDKRGYQFWLLGVFFSFWICFNVVNCYCFVANHFLVKYGKR